MVPTRTPFADPQTFGHFTNVPLSEGSTEFGGPFRTETELSDWLSSHVHLCTPEYHASLFVDTLRTCLHANATNHSLDFTHEALGMHDVLIEGDGIIAIVDQGYAG